MIATIEHKTWAAITYIYKVQGVETEEEALEAYENGEYDVAGLQEIGESIRWDKPKVVSMEEE